MTLLTLTAKAAIVGIIIGMTAKTGLIDFEIVTFYWLGVATAAHQAIMGPGKGKISLCVVVELPHQPVIGVMAGFTLVAQCLLVRVILLMATHAFGFQRLESLRQMTAVAGCKGVHAN